MEKTTLKEIGRILEESKYFDEVLQPFLDSLEHQPESPAHEVQKVLNMDFEEMSEQAKDIWFAWHKHRVLVGLNIQKILPKNVETHTLVTEKGHVCIIRKPMGRVLGQVMAKIGSLSKEPDYYGAGSVILTECRVWMEEGINNDEDEMFSVRMGCLGATKISETLIKKN